VLDWSGLTDIYLVDEITLEATKLNEARMKQYQITGTLEHNPAILKDEEIKFCSVKESQKTLWENRQSFFFQKEKLEQTEKNIHSSSVELVTNTDNKYR
jgi:hypothetical protein